MQPLSLYIHIPWCIKKCPYCDFNSHKQSGSLPEDDYIVNLIKDLDRDLEQFQPSKDLHSIFIGGGTPSLLSAKAYEQLFNALQKRFNIPSDTEITLEANPGTFEQQRFADYRILGINRLSIGIQSFNPKHLKLLGRIHDSSQAYNAVKTARNAGFDNINLDIMHGLPQQSVEEGLNDLKTALNFQPEHLSWYQLTIEPNTLFYKKTPTLPNEDDMFQLEEEGLRKLAELQYKRYEISAFSKEARQSKHNLNYWVFGDYLGIGAGAHGKLSNDKSTIRTQKHRQPKDYLDTNKPFLSASEKVEEKQLIFEYMLNTTRLEQPMSFEAFEKGTGLLIEKLMPLLKKAEQLDLVNIKNTYWKITSHGRRYTNDLQALFLPD